MTAPTAERRREPRLRCLLTGRVLFDSHQCTMDCTVRSISAHGARIDLFDSFRVSEEFDLSIPHHDQMHHAQVIWRRGKEVGLALSDVAQLGVSSRRRPTPRQKERARQKLMAESIY